MRFPYLPRPAAVAALLVLSLGPADGSARRAPQATGGQGSTLVTVDFRVLAADGTPIRDLHPEEVSLKVGGRVREIIALELMEAEARSDASASKAAPKPEPPFSTNAPRHGGRDVVILVDEEGMTAGKESDVRTTLGQLVAALSPEDHISVQTTKGGPPRVQATLRHDRVLGALAALVGRATRGESAPESVCRSRINLFALVDVLASVVPSVPTVVIFVSSGFTPPTVMESIAHGKGPPGPCELMPRDLDTLTTAAVKSRAQLIAFQIVDDGLHENVTATEMSRVAIVTATAAEAAALAVPSQAEMTAGLEHVAGITGNAIIRLIGDSGPRMQRIARETSAYYLAAFEVAASERTGGAERVEVSVTRPDVTVRAHPRLLISRPESAGGKRASGKALTPRDMLSVARSYHDLQLRASVFTSRASSDGKLRVVALFEPLDPSTRVTAAAAALFDGQSKARAQWTGQPADLKQVPVLAALTVPGPGSYRLRVAASDAAGAGGTLDEEVTIEAAAKDARWVGALVLGVTSGQAFVPRLQFVDEAVATAMVEIAGLTQTSVVAATFELAEWENGPALAVLPGTIHATSDSMAVAVVNMPIGPMPPVDVVVRAVITIDGQPVNVRPVRTLRKAAR